MIPKLKSLKRHRQSAKRAIYGKNYSKRQAINKFKGRKSRYKRPTSQYQNDYKLKNNRRSSGSRGKHIWRSNR